MKIDGTSPRGFTWREFIGGLFLREQDFCQLTPLHCQVLVGIACGKQAAYGPRMPHDQTRCDPVVADAGRLAQNTCQNDLALVALGQSGKRRLS